VVSFCAICTDELGPFVQRPLGRDDALVAVCMTCDTEQPRERYGPERGFVPSGGLLDRVASTQGARRAMGDEVYEAETARILADRASVPALRDADVDIEGVRSETIRRWRTGANQRRR
jgi:hypothetical protein